MAIKYAAKSIGFNKIYNLSYRSITKLAVPALVSIAGVVLLVSSSAAVRINHIAVSEGDISGNLELVEDPSASEGKAVVFHKPTATPTQTPAPTATTTPSSSSTPDPTPQPTPRLTNNGPGGTYTAWTFTSAKSQQLQWTMTPLLDPPASLTEEGLLHYYAVQFTVDNAVGNNVGGGYAGLQTNGLFNGTAVGKAINFSIWGSNGGKGGDSITLVNPGNQESGGYQLMRPFSWSVGTPYKFLLGPGPTPNDDEGVWVGLWIQDMNSSVVTYVGEQRVPSAADVTSLWFLSSMGMFGEDLHWWKTINGTKEYLCSAFQGSSMKVSKVLADGAAPISSRTHTNSGEENIGDNNYRSYNCEVTAFFNAAHDVQHNLGYFANPPVNSLE